MIRYLRTRPPFVCSRCLGWTSPQTTQSSQRTFQRGFFWGTQKSTSEAVSRASSNDTGANGTTNNTTTNPVDHSKTADEEHDNAVLRQIFDSPEAWNDFRRTAIHQTPTGLFGNQYLTSPTGYLAFTHASLHKAQRIVERVAAAQTDDEYSRVVGDLDRLSDLLCRVIDLCDFVRANPPEAQSQRAAYEAWATAYQYMNQLNTTTVLNDQLAVVQQQRPLLTRTWDEETQATADILRVDFAKSAVDLPQTTRDRFVELSQRISEVGSAFVDTMQPAQRWVSLPSSSCRGLDPVVARRLTRGRRLLVPPASGEAAMAMRSVVDEEARKAIYYASRTSAPASVRMLEEMLRLRASLADLAGFESYADMALSGRMMAKSPASVQRFLMALQRSNTPIVQAELADLLAAKQHDHPDATTLHAWDRDFYAARLREQSDRKDLLPSKSTSPLSHYFSLGTVMQGLSRLFQRLYGLRLVPRATPPGETWSSEVRRLDVVSDTDGHVAVLYCDLFHRGDKSPNPAHYTVRCSREITADELAEAEAVDMQMDIPGMAMPTFATAEEAASDGMARTHDRDGRVMQLPTIALVCDFKRDETEHNQPALLTYHEVDTLFHEMGHAVHSVLARTRLQTVAGTRCATDLAELPSTLMEHFVTDPAVLALFARHYETDEPVRYEQVAASLRRARRLQGLDDEGQIVLALLDQAYHTGQVDPTLEGDSTRVFRDIQTRFAHGPADPEGTSWQGFFGHLFGYGSTYYSYLFDRVLAERVWRQVFQAGRDDGALQRQHGEHLRDTLLRYGGGRDPWRCVSDALRDPRIAQGDEEAMALVGSWGISSK